MVEGSSGLRSALGLYNNGGIYYGGARVAADERSGTLFVGLGGSGADVLLRILEQIKTELPEGRESVQIYICSSKRKNR